jgi:prolyl oligopeptidase
MDAYSKVKDGVKYPAVLLMAGFNDPRLVVWQPAKMAARLQVATTSDKPVLLRVEFQAGHGLNSTKRQIDEELADLFAFLLQQMNV